MTGYGTRKIKCKKISDSEYECTKQIDSCDKLLLLIVMISIIAAVMLYVYVYFLKDLKGDRSDDKKKVMNESVVDQPEDVDEIVVLKTDHEIESLKGDFVILFAQGWCHHCRQFGPVFQRVAMLYGGKLRFYIATGDNIRQSLLNYDIQGYPTLVARKRGKVFIYDGPRQKAEDVIRWIKSL